ncbi:tRNA epoxyqueuosine(34) reductase QueG [Geomicrobium sp. JCM 19055]|uniref:tRNA epoxyqueuosine(34) reductase QueG n=1 Tax=Geomicrobium sp. JCM 19055 TaxID=1460649 RepID=UPI00045EDBF1|nr:tRNA epoxyqueuosine(34) reductase QueG [Geomicrobium sp. JCM 19055]GAK01637.1 iron-sulfur cluster-binding protein [Geomicrobium sp. JCM 19055]
MNEELKQEIIAYSKTIGIDKIGFASADPFLTLKERLREQQRLGYESGFEESDIDLRTEPERLLPYAKSIIAIALSYPSKLKNPPKGVKGKRRGLFCRASWGADYHHVLNDRLQKLQEFIESKVPDAKMASMVDTGALSDRAVAERAGIGFSGKNCMIITPEYGSYVYLGEMITTIPFEPDTPIEEGCGTCNKCVESCPTGALIQGGQLDAQKCIAFLTQKKDFIPKQYRKKIGNRLYGCDTCQVVCPINKGKGEEYQPEFEPDPEKVKPELLPLLSLSNRQFKEKYGEMAGSWRGKKPIQRNAILALGHFKEESASETLRQLLTDDARPVIRGTAAWALGEIGGDDNELAMQQALEKEEDLDVIKEIEEALT